MGEHAGIWKMVTAVCVQGGTPVNAVKQRSNHVHPFLALMGASVRIHLMDSPVCVDKDTQAFVASQSLNHVLHLHA
ncbi:hypothetical protein AB205_0122810 [Aquarana catesbeiana]|uniref:Uncharacterized protein n=1 Tax=Aquarana catesbeiana TaxID=8400 RepID=A0A2G9P1P8_AQUCT|nr:hypothetical protein AB205_0122810 [Aquarana catesbeiana]